MEVPKKTAKARKSRNRMRMPKKAPPAKRTRKEDYKEKHQPGVLNPMKMTADMIYHGLKDGTMVTGPPPPKGRYHSEQGMKFLYDAETNEEIKNWFYCEKCAWTHNVVPGGGTGNLLHHARKHIQQTYTFTKEELIDALVKASEYTQSTGSVPDFKKILPTPENWYVNK